MGCSPSLETFQNETMEAHEAREHVVVVSQDGQNPLGLKFSIKDGRLLVRAVEDGAITAWNAKHPEYQICSGDEVLSVNGESGSQAKMLTQLHMMGQVEMHFRSRPQGSASSRCCKQHGGQGCDHHRAEPQRRKPAKGTQLVELPFVSAAHLEDATCCICLESMEPDVRVLQLPCQHHFHLECGAQWLRQKGTCPLCVRPIVAPESGADEVPKAGEARTESSLGSEAN